MSNSSLKSARMTIELDTQDAEARLDELEEKLNALNDDVEDQDKELTKNEKRASGTERAREDREGSRKPTIDNTGPGRFGLRNLPHLLGAAEFAGVIPVIGGAARFAINAEQKFGPFAEGVVEAVFEKVGVAPAVARQAVDQADFIHRLGADIDKRLKAVEPTFDATLKMAQAQLLTGGHINPEILAKFVGTQYEWEFVNQRKDQDIRDKTIRMLGEQAPSVIKDLFMAVFKGKLAP